MPIPCIFVVKNITYIATFICKNFTLLSTAESRLKVLVNATIVLQFKLVLWIAKIAFT